MIGLCHRALFSWKLSGWVAPKLRELLGVIFSLCVSVAMPASVSVVSNGASSATVYSLSGAAYAQDFNTLPNSGTFTWSNNSTLPGWYVVTSAGTFNATAVVSDGVSNLADLTIASVGSSGSSDRALAHHTRVVTTPTYVGLGFTNDSTRELNSFSLTYTPEQWKEGTNQRTLTFTVQYRIGASAADLNSSTGWTTISGLGFSSLNGSVGATATLTANAVAVSVPAGSTIWFRWVTANDATAATSSHDTIAIDNVSVSFAALSDGSPTITTQPVSQSVTVGANVTFSVVANGDPTLTYVWKKGADVIANANLASLALTNVQAADAGSYTVEVTNSKGTAISVAATLGVSVPVAPSITTQPVSQTVDVGTDVTLTVIATGSAPLSYQWKKGESTILNATSSSLTLTGVQTADSGDYTVQVSNGVGNALSNVATLTVQVPPPQAPAITTHPQTQTVSVGTNVTLSVVATGTAPLAYQWQKNSINIPNAISSSLVLNNAQAADAGSYRVIVSNGVNPSATSNAATLTVAASLPLSSFNLTGFATVGTGTTGGGVIPETDAAYRKVSTPQQFVQAIIDSNKTAGAVKVIEIMNDLNMGWNEVGATVRALLSNPLRAHATPKLHPTLITSGVSLLDIKAKSPLTIFSANGATIKHVNFNIKGTSNIIIRNLKFDELWEWDEASKGDYDSNDWDFITIANGGDVSNVWIDHCTFTKSYDGIVDLKAGASNITFSWCRYIGDDGATNPNSHVRIQLAALEATKSSHTGYRFLRDTVGFTIDEIAVIVQGQDKGHLMGANSLKAENALLTATFHHQWFKNVWDRVTPRLRGGNVHNYNIYIDDNVALQARRMRDAKVALLSTSVQNSFNNGSPYKLRPFLNGTISTENGAILVEKSLYSDCITPLRNNQTDPTNSAYTGKIMALDTIYSFNNVDGSTTVVRGNSTDSGNPLGPFQATIIPFSWSLPTNQLPYTISAMDDPAQLPAILAVGTGAGALTWSKDNWLRTAYVESTTIPPSIVAPPQSATIATGADATFIVQAAGSATLTYQWKKGGVNLADDTRISGATSSVLTISGVTNGDAGNYTVTVTNGNGNVTSAAAALTVVAPTAPSITAQPEPQVVLSGHGVQFSVTVAGSAPFSYQWKKNGQDVVGATGAIFEIEFTQETDAGNYSVVVSNLADTVTSTSVSLTVTSATTAPAVSAASSVGNNGFTANWTAVEGATNYLLDVSNSSTFATFVPGYQDFSVGDVQQRAITGLTSATAYYYRVRAVGPNGTSASSSTITVTTSGPVTTSIDSSLLTWYQTRTADTVTLNTTAKTVTFTEGQTSASSYVTHLPSAVNLAVGQTMTVTITFETGANAKSVTNALRFGLFNSNATRITASANTETNAVFNDDTGYVASYNFDTGVGTLYSRIPGGTNSTLMGSTAAGLYLSASASLLSGTPAPISSSSAYTLTLTLARQQSAMTFTARLNGGNTVDYLLSGTDTATPSLATASFDQFALRIAGGTNSIDNLKLTGLQFAVEETSVPNQPPVITLQPQTQTVSVGAAVTLSVSATGTTPFTYQWRKNEQAINNANSATYSIPSAATTDSGSYDVLVTNSLGTTPSSVATLTVTQPMPAPVAASATAVGNNGFTANWSAAAGATSYRLDVSTSSSFGSFVAGYQNLDVGNVLNRVVTGLTSGTAHYYRIRAVGSNGTSVSSSTISVTTTGPVTTSIDGSLLTWYQTRTADAVTLNTTAKTVTFTEGQTSSSSYITYLPSVVNLAVGQTMTMTISFETGANAKSVANALRFGLFNSNTTRVSANANTETNAVFNDDTGYVASYNFDTGAGTLYSRIPGGTNSTLMGSTATGLYLSAGASVLSGAPAPIISSSVYTLTITLSRQEAAVVFTSRLNGGNTGDYLLSGTDGSTPSVATASFDQFALRIAGGSNSIDTLKLTGLQYAVEATPVAPTGFVAWLQQHFTESERNNPAISGVAASPLGDGVPNLLKYALGLAPLNALPGNWHQTEFIAGGWVFIYQRPADRPDVTYQVEVTTDLASWTTNGVAHELESSNGGSQTWRAIYVPPVGVGQAFFRLRVTR